MLTPEIPVVDEPRLTILPNKGGNFRKADMFEVGTFVFCEDAFSSV